MKYCLPVLSLEDIQVGSSDGRPGLRNKNYDHSCGTAPGFHWFRLKSLWGFSPWASLFFLEYLNFIINRAAVGGILRLKIGKYGIKDINTPIYRGIDLLLLTYPIDRG